MIKTVIFDCFGVLTEDGWLAFCNKYRTSENSEALRYINHQIDKGLVGYEEFLDEVCRLTGVPREQAHSTITTVHHPNIPLFEYIEKLKTAGYRLGVISNVGDELNNFLPQKYVDLFTDITLSYQVGAIKPSQQIYETHLNKSGIAPSEAVFIDDREPNIAGAKAVGMYGIVYVSQEDVAMELEKLGVHVD
jgi:HAD superfamily hydrolase (TIGR01509 family)